VENKKTWGRDKRCFPNNLTHELTHEKLNEELDGRGNDSLYKLGGCEIDLGIIEKDRMNALQEREHKWTEGISQPRF
jgi:hypothetical protein